MQIDKNVERELINHRSLLHPNIIRFKEVSLHHRLFACGSSCINLSHAVQIMLSVCAVTKSTVACWSCELLLWLKFMLC